jgi:hypothetical protein
MVHYPILSDPNLDQSNSHQQSFWFIPHFHSLATMQDRRSSLHNRGATTIQIDYTQLGIYNLTTYVEPNLAYDNPHLDHPRPERVHRHPRVQYSSNPAQF